MKTLSQRLDEYLTLRRSFGYDLSFDERVLRKFVIYGDGKGHRCITTALFLAWKADYGSANNHTWSHRLGMVRRFALWLVEHDDQTEVPPSQLVTGRYKRRKPYIYSYSQIEGIVVEAGRLPSAYGLRASLWQTLFGLIAVTGMRINEALALENRDVDLVNAVLTVRQSKNGKNRHLPIQPSAVKQLSSYAGLRDRITDTKSRRFFVKEDGRPAGDCGARYTFAKISRNVGLRSPQKYNKHGRGPRIHDLRHSFAVHTILDWFRDGRNIEREMYKLSTYLGHSKPKHTFWYIEAVPELMQLAVERAEASMLEAGS